MSTYKLIKNACFTTVFRQADVLRDLPVTIQ